MGSFVEINDTLQLTAEQGFPADLNLDRHVNEPLGASDFEGRVFEFTGKSDIRNYQQTPVRVFLVENRDGRWIYWGLVHVLSVTHDYEAKATSGKYRLVKLFTPKEMIEVFDLIDGRPDFNYFNKS